MLVPFILVTTFEGTVAVDEYLTFYCATNLNAAQMFGRIVPSALSDWSRENIVADPDLLLSAFCWIAAGGYIVWLCLYGLSSGMTVTLPTIVLPCICSSRAERDWVCCMGVNKSSRGFLGSQI